jgi:hypothetical protein
LWWFAQLDSALERDDERAVASAVRNLEQLGIEVRFRVPPKRTRRRVKPGAVERKTKGLSDATR